MTDTRRLVRSVRGIQDAPRWYKDAVIYELRVRSFMDGNGDGIGDFAGLTSRLDYLEDLGVTTLWLLPFYPSPGLDDGYDIADYTDIHPELGTLDEFRRFLDVAHRRGLRVVTELVLNHTSDQHPWFQRARRAAPGTSERDFYVWSDTPDRYKETRIIFKDFEPSNWSWDPLARAYYWHRFYAHQPDLNFDNPAVHDAMFSVVDFWLGLGVDGLRLDAVPYLYEREGTNCENLPETHAFLKKLRAHVDERYDNRMLLAEANQWPEDAAAYFGDGDECHMNFHFPIMPRLFMAIHMEDRFPIIDILEQTPELDASSQWALFLRNHDELTLEMVTEEERDYMWRAYAHEPAMRINLGIRRRLAPLVGNNRRNIELMNGLLFSMPGTPVLYYGDEIGMGDNVYLGDRNGVRTPMQWSADRNAGFSRANPQRLILPVIIDPEYHFESVNVEAQQDNTNSLLWWMKRIIALRKRFRAFGRGSVRFLHPDNPRVLAFVREHEGERILVVANLSRHVQYVELDLSAYEGLTPVELFGRNEFPRIGELPYLLTLGAHAFYWFSLERPELFEENARVAAYAPPELEVPGSWTTLLEGDARWLLERALPDYVVSRPWFTGERREVVEAEVVDVIRVPAPRPTYLLVVHLVRDHGAPRGVVLPVAFVAGEEARLARQRVSHAVVADVAFLGEGGVPVSGCLVDAVADPDASLPLLDLLAAGRSVRGATGRIEARAELPVPGPDDPRAPRSVKGSHHNAVVIYGDRYLLKVFRRLGEGVSPDVEIGRFLHGAPPGDPRALAPTPPLVAALSYREKRGQEPVTLAALHAYVPHEADARSYTLEELARYFERTLTRSSEAALVPEVTGCVVSRLGERPIDDVAGLVGAYLDTADLLGARVAELHLALTAPDVPDFAPEPCSTLYQRSVYQSLRNLAGTVLRTLKGELSRLDGDVADNARTLLSERGRLYERFAPLLDNRIRCTRGRYHGDLHLEKVLYTGRDFFVIDFDGNRDKPLTERRRKRSPLRDVASMLRSFHDAAYTALLDPAVIREQDRELAEPWANLWLSWVGSRFLTAYVERAGGAPFVPGDRDELQLLLDVLLIERALHELGGALSRGGERVAIPLIGLLQMLERGA